MTPAHVSRNALPILFPFPLVSFQFETLFLLRVLAADGTPVVWFLVPGVSLIISVVVVVVDVSVSVAVSVVAVAAVAAVAVAAVAVAAVAVAVSVVVVVVVVAFCTQSCCELSILFDQLADLILLFLYDF